MPGNRGFNTETMRKDQARAYARVGASCSKVKNLTKMVDAATDEMKDAIVRAANLGITHSALAELTGYTEPRIWQIVNAWHPAKRKGRQ